MIATKGSTSPFGLPAGLVIFNRTSGSTLPNNTDDNTVVITATATVTTTVTTVASSLNPIMSTSSSASASVSPATSQQSSSAKEVAIGAGVGGALGLALLIASILLWRLRKQKQGLAKDVRTWEDKNQDSVMATKAPGLAGMDHRAPLSSELHGQHRLVCQLEGWMPDEIDGVEVREVANTTRRG